MCSNWPVSAATALTLLCYPTHPMQVSALGVAPDRIVFANPCKRPKDLRCAADRGVELTTFDTEAGEWPGGLVQQVEQLVAPGLCGGSQLGCEKQESSCRALG